MVVYEVYLMQTQTFQSKKVFVEANTPDEAFKKARMIQVQPGRWATVIAKPQGIYTKKFQHKGLAKRS